MLLTPRRRVLATLVLAAGAAASIATSQLPSQTHATFYLDAVVLHELSPRVGFELHVEHRADLFSPAGSLIVSLEVERDPVALGGGQLDIQIVDDATGDVVVEEVFTYDGAAGGSQSALAALDPWDGCTSGGACDYTVWIELTDPSAALRVTGSIEVDLVEESTDSDATEDTELTIEGYQVQESP